MKESVLIIHNSVDEQKTQIDKQWQLSNAGVLDEVRAVAESLKRLGINCQVSDIADIHQLPAVLEKNRQKIIFNLVEELPRRIQDACLVPAVCFAKVRFCTGSDTGALLLAQNKWQAKAIMKAAGIPCPDGIIIEIGEKFNFKNLDAGTYIVKPLLADASEGIDQDSVAEAASRPLRNAVERIHKQFFQPAVVEQFIDGPEINVSLLERGGSVDCMPLAEIDFSAFGPRQRRIVDYSAKWQSDSFAYNNTPRIIPARVSEETAEHIRSCAVKAWKAIGCRDYARVDFRVDSDGNPFVLEVNPNPDISPDAGFAAAITAGGLCYDDFIKALLDNVIKRDSEYSLLRSGK